MTQTQEDIAKIAAYRKTLGKYPKPSVTADIVAVRPAYSELGEGQWRENPEFALASRGGDPAAVRRTVKAAWPIT